jgi:hypothetical protein
MSMETTAWTQLHSVMTAQQERRPLARATLRRIAAFARPHRRRIARFVLLGVGAGGRARAPPRHAAPGARGGGGGGGARPPPPPPRYSPAVSWTRSSRTVIRAPSSDWPC